MTNRYLEKIALNVPAIGRSSVVKSIGNAVSRGGVKGSVFGKTTTLKPSIVAPKPMPIKV